MIVLAITILIAEEVTLVLIAEEGEESLIQQMLRVVIISFALNLGSRDIMLKLASRNMDFL